MPLLKTVNPIPNQERHTSVNHPGTSTELTKLLSTTKTILMKETKEINKPK